MQEKVEKYIYFISDNRFRVKFLKVDKKNNIKINFDEYINGTLDDARNLRDKKLKENGLTLEKEKKKDIFFEEQQPNIDKSNIKKEKKERKVAANVNTKKVDKYIYEIEKGKKYRIFIRKGESKGQKGDYY